MTAEQHLRAVLQAKEGALAAYESWNSSLEMELASLKADLESSKLEAEALLTEASAVKEEWIAVSEERDRLRVKRKITAEGETVKVEEEEEGDELLSRVRSSVRGVRDR